MCSDPFRSIKTIELAYTVAMALDIYRPLRGLARYGGSVTQGYAFSFAPGFILSPAFAGSLSPPQTFKNSLRWYIQKRISQKTLSTAIPATKGSSALPKKLNMFGPR
jgi:hypothetical protein